MYYKQLLGKEIVLEDASEPTDIIWENREITKKYRDKCTVIVWIVISLLLTGSGAIIYYCSYTSTALKTRYPMTACDETISTFGS